VIVHWDEVERDRFEWEPATKAYWSDLGRAAGSVGVGVRRMEIDPEKLSVPVHVHSAEEEIVFVLSGSGWSWQHDTTYPIGPGDCIVHLPDQESHTLVAGENGLEALVYGTRLVAEFSYLPRTGRGHTADFWFEISRGDAPPEQPAAPPEPVDERPPNIVNLAEVEAETWGGRDMGGVARFLGQAAGSRRTGLNHEVIQPGKLNTAPHCHSAEEEIFLVLDGEATLLLGDEEHAVRAGHVVARPPGTGIAHAFRAETELTLLSYGTREPNDITYYPRSDVFALRGIKLIGRLERLSSDDVW
jgi:uncharacterized cupin superfamily protein